MLKSSTLLFFGLLTHFAFSQNQITPIWKNDFKIALNSVNKAKAVKTDRLGNCFVLGTTSINESNKDICLVKYSPDGKELWRRTYNNKADGDDFPKTMVVDLYGNSWICGIAKLSTGEADFLVTEFSGDGIPLLDFVFDGPDHLFDEANCITADKFGNVYAAGYSTSIDSGIDIFVTRFRANGTLAWKRKYATTKLDIANALITDDSCNVYICGNTNNSQRSSDIIVLKYDSTGNQKWRQVYDGVFGERDAADLIALDDSVNVYVTGFVNHTSDRSDLPILKYNRNGVLVKETFYNGISADCDATSLRVEKDMIYLTGNKIDYNTASAGGVLLKYNKAGKEKLYLKTPEETQFIATHRFGERQIVFGTKLIHPESTLIPFVAEIDTLPQFRWEFKDSTIYGISHFVDVEIDHDFIYFLGDDAGDATGTINIIKYKINSDADNKKKSSTLKSYRSGIPKNK